MSVEKVKRLASEASKERLFLKVKEVKIGEKTYRIRRPSRKEMYESGLQLEANILDDMKEMIRRESDLEKRKKLWEQYLKMQYDYEKKLLLKCVEGMTEEELDKMDYGEYYVLVNQVIRFIFLTPLRELSERRGSLREPTPTI